MNSTFFEISEGANHRGRGEILGGNIELFESNEKSLVRKSKKGVKKAPA